MFKLVTRFVQVLGVLNAVFIWGFTEYLVKNRPSHPTGNFTVQVAEHGTLIYVSPTEQLISVLAWPLFFIILVVCIGLESANGSGD